MSSSDNRTPSQPAPAAAPAVTPAASPAAPALVACQGIEGAYSHLAARSLFPDSSLLYFRNFRAVARAVSQGMCRYGVLPIENNTYGSVREVYRVIGEENVCIVRSTTLRISHRLLALPGASLSGITRIYSHEQALGQCADFLHSLGDKVRVVPCLNTAVAARTVAQGGDPHAAAISSPECAALYDLKTLKKDIADTTHNYTRFICIAAAPEILPGASRLSIVLSVQHRPGALAAVLQEFAKAGIDMLKIESAPVPGRDFEFRFYIDLAATVSDPAVTAILQRLGAECPEYRYLGSYTEEKVPEAAPSPSPILQNML